MKELQSEDRGLAVAHERHSFYQRLDGWARTYGVESMLEGPLDGIRGIQGVHGVGLARRGVKVVAAVPSEGHAAVVRGVYATCGAAFDVRVQGQAEVATLPRSDLVLCYRALGLAADWRGYLAEMAKLARKALVVVVGNPDHWGSAMMNVLGRARSERPGPVPESSRTEVLAPELWKVGRVKEHSYFDHRLAGKASERYVYGEGRWPYFGGSGWLDELMPALLESPSLDEASPRWRARTAHLHAFVVDVRPRTARERRRLAQIEDTTTRG